MTMLANTFLKLYEKNWKQTDFYKLKPGFKPEIATVNTFCKIFIDSLEF